MQLLPLQVGPPHFQARVPLPQTCIVHAASTRQPRPRASFGHSLPFLQPLNADFILCPPHRDDVLLVAAEGHGFLTQADGVLARAHAVELLQLGLTSPDGKGTIE